MDNPSPLSFQPGSALPTSNAEPIRSGDHEDTERLRPESPAGSLCTTDQPSMYQKDLHVQLTGQQGEIREWETPKEQGEKGLKDELNCTSGTVGEDQQQACVLNNSAVAARSNVHPDSESPLVISSSCSGDKPICNTLDECRASRRLSTGELTALPPAPLGTSIIVGQVTNKQATTTDGQQSATAGSTRDNSRSVPSTGGVVVLEVEPATTRTVDQRFSPAEPSEVGTSPTPSVSIGQVRAVPDVASGPVRPLHESCTEAELPVITGVSISGSAVFGQAEGFEEEEEEEDKVLLPAGKVAGDGIMAYTKIKDGTSERSPLLENENPQSEDPIYHLRKNPTSFRISRVILVLVFVCAGLALIGGLIFGVVSFVTEEDELMEDTDGAAAVGAAGLVKEFLPGFEPLSATGEYRFAAVAADAGQCSSIGTYVLAERRGSLVDAAISSLLCLGIHNAHSMGIGGGHFMMIYDTPKGKDKREMFALDSREMAPGAASTNMYANASSETGGLAIAVPGEIKGLHTAWSRFGRLPWSDLFAPAIEMCRSGYRVGPSLGDAIRTKEEVIRNTPMLRELYVKPDGELYKEGDLMTNPLLGDTLERIANGGAEIFYNGELADDIYNDIKECDGIITREDLANYESLWRRPSVSMIQSLNLSVHTMPAPSSGPAMQYMFNILDGFKLSPSDIDFTEERILTYHRIIETFKFGYARRSYLGDPSFEDVSQLSANLTSQWYADATRAHITDDRTHPVEYYHPANRDIPETSGTSHLSIVGPDGGAVAVTSTINTFFGSKCRGRRTGIILNNEMDDFNKPGDERKYGFTSAIANFIEPGKRPLSSMVPTIILNHQGEPVYVVGGSGGKKITAGVTYVTTHALWLGKRLNEAIDHPRLHHQLLPDLVSYEPRIDRELLEGLREKGHDLSESSGLAVIQGIYSSCGWCRPTCTEPCLYATSDYRKGGYPDGY